MQYRRLGSAGLKVSELSLGSWVTFHTQLDDSKAVECIKTAIDAGINFFDNAEGYAAGESEAIMGRVFRKLGLRRSSYCVSTKFYWGLHDGPNERNTLNRKYLMQAIDGSLKRLQMEYVDLVFCHRPDADTPIEETVRAMHEMILQGKALYWGTSEWSAEQIMQAWQVAERHHLHKPQMEQPQYNMFVRERVEREYARLYSDLGLGLTTWSPLASGVLTGKYNRGIPKGSRASLPGYEWIADRVITKERLEAVARLESVAGDLGCSVAQMAIAWCVKNPKVSTVILGASSVEQLNDNLKAQPIIAKLTAEVMAEINSILANDPNARG
jgi:voltage-dependent potassium channel beta subunit